MVAVAAAAAVAVVVVVVIVAAPADAAAAAVAARVVVVVLVAAAVVHPSWVSCHSVGKEVEQSGCYCCCRCSVERVDYFVCCCWKPPW